MDNKMLSKHVVEEARKKLLDIMLNRPSVGRGIGSCGSSGGDGASMGTRKLLLKVEKSMKSELSNISTQLHAVKESQEEIKGEVISVKKSQEEMKGEVKSMENALEGVKGEVHSLEGGLDAVKNVQEEMKNGLDAVKKSLEGVKCVATTTQPENVSNSNEGEIILQMLYAKEVREKCIEGMMGKTKVYPSNDGKRSKMRKLYEKMYDRDSILSTILQFIQLQSVEVHVDFRSTLIGGMKPTLRDHDGREKSGNGIGVFADFEERKAYVGGDWSDGAIIARLALALSQLCVLLAFGNRGLPYSKDGEGEREYKGILEEAERKKGELDWWIRYYTLDKRTTPIGKEIYLHAMVPAMIALYGSSEGRSMLNNQLPSLLVYFEKHVMTALRGEETMKRIAAEMVTRL